MKSKIIILTPMSPDLLDIVQDRFIKQAEHLNLHGDDFVVVDHIISQQVELPLPNDKGAISKVARIRNKLIGIERVKDSDFIVWLDADLVEFPPSLIETLFIQSKVHNAVIAPMNLVELSDKWYDWGAFIQGGTSDMWPEVYRQIWGRNLSCDPPYWHPGYSRKRLMPMDSVAQCLIVPTEVYRKGAYHSDEGVYFEFFSVCQKAKEMGIMTYVDTTTTCFHADRSMYGRNWG